MKDHHKKFTELNKLVPRTEHNINKKKKVLIYAENLYNELYYIYKNKHNKKINNLHMKNRKKLVYKKLRLTDNYQYPSEEEQEEIIKKKKQEKTKTDIDEFSKYIAEK